MFVWWQIDSRLVFLWIFWKANTPLPSFFCRSVAVASPPSIRLMDVAQETRSYLHRQEGRQRKIGERRRGQRKDRKEISPQHNTMLLRLHSQPLLRCPVVLDSILWTQLSVRFLFLIPTQGSIPQATDCFKTAFIVARCFFWLQEGLTLPHHTNAERILLPTLVWACVCLSLYIYSTCVHRYVNSADYMDIVCVSDWGLASPLTSYISTKFPIPPWHHLSVCTLHR